MLGDGQKHSHNWILVQVSKNFLFEAVKLMIIETGIRLANLKQAPVSFLQRLVIYLLYTQVL